MSDRIESGISNLTLVPRPRPEGGSGEVSAEVFAGFMHDPTFIENERRIVSIRDQLSITLQPPTIVVTDHAESTPLREPLIRVSVAVIEILEELNFAIAAYGWNIAGSIRTSDATQAIRGLTNTHQITTALGSRKNEAWRIPQIQVELGSASADLMTIALELQTASEMETRVRFTVNAHFDRHPQVDMLSSEAATIQAEASAFVSRLVSA